ncbi:MAG: hypothetical protein JW955_10035 [Sedimentisphaerales bacterium]|nr:hypothetical protein [Sedimentisphaerales bacterium]
MDRRAFVIRQAVCVACVVVWYAAAGASAHGESLWDISPFGQLTRWPSEDSVGVCWQQERDIDSVEVVCSETQDVAMAAEVQYWSRTWPGEPPSRHTIEDRFDDPWQGRWLTAQTEAKRDGSRVTYRFKPLTTQENERADNLPEPVEYRRTLKVRLLYEKDPPAIASLKVYSPTEAKIVSVRIEFGCGKPVSKPVKGRLEVFNGYVEKVTGWGWDGRDEMVSDGSWRITAGEGAKGVVAELKTAKPRLPGSNDLTIVTVRSSEGVFSFLVDDLNNGPIYVPAYGVFVTWADDPNRFADANLARGQTVRQKIAAEPEQTYDRARKEIPPLDVMLREDGGRLYLPVAVDASWQKFAVEWGGGFFLNKDRTKAKGKERQRCNWQGAELHWYIGTGAKPIYDRNDVTSQMSVLNDYLPVPIVRWNHDGLSFYEEAFATLLDGPLSPYDSQRSEQTPAILMLRLRILNPTDVAKTAHIWLKPDRLYDIGLQGAVVLDKIGENTFLRMHMDAPDGATAAVEKGAIHHKLPVGAHQATELILRVPFVGDLAVKDGAAVATLDYQAQRDRVVSYWRDIVARYRPFDVPEQKFNDMSKSVICHIRMSATKDPKSGLFMVPAATFSYQVFANESAFQTLFLDRIGDHETSANYLETFLRLQGSVPMPGTFTGPQKGVLHGTKVDNNYNYTMGPYNLDHGTVLWGLAQHYLMSHDQQWLSRIAPNMLRAADWIIEQRNQTRQVDEKGEPVLHYGLLPAGRLEDNDDWGYWFANNAYAWLGLRDTARALTQAGLPDGDRLTKEADAYIKDLGAAVKRTSELAPVVRLRNGTYVPFVPSRAYQRFRYFGPMRSGYYNRYKENTLLTFRLSATREALYGPLILITTGVLDPHDVLSEAILDDWEDNITLSSSLGQHIHGVVDDEYWFSRGGMVFQPNLQNPIQAYLLRNEIPAATRSLYNAMTSCLYPDVTAFTEEYRRWRVGSGPMYKIPDEARFVNRVCDLLAMDVGDELWLAPGTPRRWLEPGRRIKVYGIETVFGKVAYEMRHGDKPGTIEANVVISGRTAPRQVLLFVRSPLNEPIGSVRINGEDWRQWNDDREAVILPVRPGTMQVTVSYE